MLHNYFLISLVVYELSRWGFGGSRELRLTKISSLDLDSTTQIVVGAGGLFRPQFFLDISVRSRAFGLGPVVKSLGLTGLLFFVPMLHLNEVDQLDSHQHQQTKVLLRKARWNASLLTA